MQENIGYKKKIKEIIPILQKAALGDFSVDIDIPKQEDEFTEFLVVLKLMIDDLHEYKDEMDKKVFEQTKKLNESQEKYKSLYLSSQDAIMTLEPPLWNFTAGNQATIKLFGLKDEKQFILLNPGDLSPKKQPDGQLSSKKSKKEIDKAIQSGSNLFEWIHKKFDGESFASTVLLTRVEFGNRKFLQATVRDVSKERQFEKTLKEKIEDVEKINKLMVGRELKMIELKEKNKKLEKLK
jgi:PAS domain S-box-containing protein